MSNSTTSPRSLASLSSSAASKAQTVADEIDSLLGARSDDAIKTELDRLSLLGTSLRQLRHHAEQLVPDSGAATHGQHIRLPPGLSAAQSRILPLCERALATIAKQICRLDNETPRQCVNSATVALYDDFAKAVTALYIVLRQHLVVNESGDTAAVSDEALATLGRAEAAGNQVLQHDGILTDTGSSGTGHQVDTASTKSTAPAGHQGSELPPYSVDASNAAPVTSTSPTSTTQNVNTRQDQDAEGAGGFFGSLSTSFKAMTAGMRYRPEPFVVPLCEAATRGDISQMQGLLGAGANINGYNEAGLTPLICAVQSPQVDAARFLLKAGADYKLSSSGRKGKPPLYYAALARCEPVFDALLSSGATMESSDSWFLDLVMGEASSKSIAMLLARGANVHAKDSSSRSAIVLTVHHRKKVEDADEVVATLLAHGADPNAQDLTGTPLVHSCLQQDRDHLLSLLIERGASINGTNVYGNSLVTEALKRAKPTLVKTLIARGANVNATDSYGIPLLISVLTSTSLSIADKADLVELLTRNGARCSTTDNWAVTALDHAVANIASKTGPVSDADLRIIDLLLGHGADANQRLSKQSGYPNLLTYSLDRQEWALLRVALDGGAQPNVADAKGRTPLLIAMQHGNPDIVALLTQKGADKNLPGQVTPFEMARASRDPRMMQVLGVPLSETRPEQRHVSLDGGSADGTRPISGRLDSVQEADVPPRYEDHLV